MTGKFTGIFNEKDSDDEGLAFWKKPIYTKGGEKITPMVDLIKTRVT